MVLYLCLPRHWLRLIPITLGDSRARLKAASAWEGRDSQLPPRTQTTSIDMHPAAAAAPDSTKSNYDIVNAGLAQENERLKQVVKEMRIDVENLQQQVLDQSHMAETGALADLACRRITRNCKSDLKTAAEVVRLKAERKTLMDIGNELRSALNREYGGEMIASAAGASAGRAAGGIPPPRTLAFYPQQQQQRAGPGAGAGSGPMYFNYQYDASAIATARHFQQEEARRAAADQPPSDAIAMINAFEGDHPDQHQATSDNVSGIGVRGRGVPNTGNNYNRGYGATAGRTGVNTHGRYGATTGANKATSSSSVRHPTANAATRAASAQTRSGPRKVMNYARGDEKDEG